MFSNRGSGGRLPKNLQSLRLFLVCKSCTSYINFITYCYYYILGGGGVSGSPPPRMHTQIINFFSVAALYRYDYIL